MMFGYVELSDDAIGRLRSEGISIKGITTETADAATVYSNVAEAPPAYGEKHDYIMVKKELEMKDQLLAAKQDTIDRLDKNLQMAIAQLGAAAKK